MRLVTFDAFGTLFRVLGNPAAAYVREASRHGIKLHTHSAAPAFMQAFRLQSNRYPNYGRRHETINAKLWWQEVVRMTLINAGANEHDLDRDGKFDSIFESLFHAFTKADEYSIYEDVKPVLATLRDVSAVRMGVISNSDGRTEQVLQSLGLAQYFDFTITSYELNHEKPDSDIFEKALELASEGLAEPIKPNEALHIGDDELRDYQGAKNAGWEALLLLREDEEHAPDYSGSVSNADLVTTLMPVVERVPTSSDVR